MRSHYDKDRIIRTFKYDPSDEGSIVSRTKNLIGLSISDIIKASPVPVKKRDPSNKGAIGNIVEESWFGIWNNPSPEPDFADLGIELKVVPLEASRKGLSVKERTKVCAIDYLDLITQAWMTSHAKKKLNKVLFVYFKYDPDDVLNSRVIDFDLWALSGRDAVVIRDDWERVRQMVEDGLAHELSETISRILAASRTGSGGRHDDGRLKDQVSQPRSSVPALRRAFSLKQSFTKQRWLEIHKKVQFESVVSALGSSINFEDDLLGRLREFEGKTLREFSHRFGIPIPNGKNAAATIIKKAIGFKNVNSHIKEFEQYGITVKVVPVRRSDNMPWESVSFPYVRLRDLVKEYWDEASILEHVERILFIPIYRNTRADNNIGTRVMGKAFFWSPSYQQWEQIEKEWTMYRGEVRAGKAKPVKTRRGHSVREVTSLTKESKTVIIHMRPHGRDMDDRDIDPKGNSVVKQSFWLNKAFVHQLINASVAAK